MRGFGQRNAFKAQMSSSLRIQQCVRSWLRNVDLQKRVLCLFEAARRGDVREVTRSVTESPHLLYVRDRYGRSSVVDGGGGGGEDDDGLADASASPCYTTLLQAACEVRSLSTNTVRVPQYSAVSLYKAVKKIAWHDRRIALITWIE